MPSKTAKNYRRKAKRPGSKRHLLRRRWLAAALALVMLAGGGLYYLRRASQPAVLPPPPANAAYKQTGQPIETRIEDLLSYMTLDEKIGQMALVDKNSLKKTIDVSKYSLGGLMSGAGAKPKNNTPQGWLDMVSRVKKQALQSRLGIPILYGVDANHGHGNVPGSTIFPHAIGLGAAGDSELTKAVAAATAEELAATGVNWNFSPSLDAPKDIRWGRVYEAFSDNPELNAKLGAAFIEGTQTKDNSSGTYVLATAKHFVGLGSMQWNSSKNKNFKIDHGAVPANEALLTSQYLPPYRVASAANVSSVMIGLSDWGDSRTITSKGLITDKLKADLGFEGFVVSDWYGVYEYAGVSKYKANIEAINAGLDMAMLPFDYKAFIKDVRRAVEREEISQSRIDDAVRRILRQKFLAGLFDSTTAAPGLDIVGSAPHRGLARQSVADSAVVLKNEGSLLPLSKQAGRILIAGSGADNIGRQCGAWTVEWQGIDGNWLKGATSILEGIRQVAGPYSDIDYGKGANFNQFAGKAEVGIAIVSEKPYAEGWGDNAYPTLEAADIQAIERLKALSDKVIIIIVSGRPLFMQAQIDQADAVAAVWLPGSEGAGVADVLFGNRLFRGKLPLRWPST